MYTVLVDKKLILDAGAGIFWRVYNNSASTIAGGEVCVLDTGLGDVGTVAVKRTTTLDDPLVYGVAINDIPTKTEGTVQWAGVSIVDVKVDGTADIAVDDNLSCFTTNGIAGKATTGKGGVFGVALEAYTTNDSAGLIKVFITPAGRNDASSLSAALSDNTVLAFGTGTDVLFDWSTADADNHSFVAALGDSNQALHVTDKGATATDWDVAADTHPTVYVHSNTTPATDYLKVGVHDGSAAWGADMVGGGTLNFGFDGLEALVLIETASAVNETHITNAATGDAPVIAAAGGDTNISLRLTAKGTGVIQTTQPLVEEMTQSALTNTATVTIAQLLTKVLDGTPTSGATYTLPTAADLVAGIANAQVGDSFFFVINNKSGGANTITVAAGSSGTADGTLTVAQNVVRTFLIIVTNVTGASEAYFVYGTG